METPKAGTKVKIKDTPESAELLAKLGVTARLAGREGVVLTGVVSSEPPQVEVKFDNMEPKENSWLVPVDDVVMEVLGV